MVCYLQKRSSIKYEYKPKENNAHDGFVAIDSEGYLWNLKFKQHPENEKLMPRLQNTMPSGATDRWSKMKDSMAQ